MQLLVIRILALLAAPILLGAQSAPQWRLVEVWRKGGAVEGAYAFDNINSRVGDIAVAPGGRVVVLDPNNSRIHILDSMGTVVRSVGRRGSGPGEMERAWTFAVSRDGRMVVNDYRNGRFVVFGPNGDFLRTISAQRGPVFAYDLTWDASFDRAGRLLSSVSIRARAPKPVPGAPPGFDATGPIFDSTLVTERWSADFTKVDSVSMCTAVPPIAFNTREHVMVVSGGRGAIIEKNASGAAPVPSGPIVGWVNVPFAEQKPAFVRDWDGFEWSARAAGSGEIVRRENGKCAFVLASATLRGPQTPIPAARRDSAAKDERAEVVARIPRQYPWFHALYVDDENRLWVERDVATGKRFDVFAADGRPLAEIPAPTGLLVQYPLSIGNGRLFGFVKNADDVPYLVAWRIAR
ncbi:MAG TPA: 6-bladed beta-propeller [Gemmatimonadaceae bacterium]|nr:6-bladed beta-propeller [Gemmatimonadaceae bacterium]